MEMKLEMMKEWRKAFISNKTRLIQLEYAHTELKKYQKRKALTEPVGVALGDALGIVEIDGDALGASDGAEEIDGDDVGSELG